VAPEWRRRIALTFASAGDCGRRRTLRRFLRRGVRERRQTRALTNGTAIQTPDNSAHARHNRQIACIRRRNPPLSYVRAIFSPIRMKSRLAARASSRFGC
jgi:hypothetical protein